MLWDRIRTLRELAGNISNRELDRVSGITLGHSWAIENVKRPSVELKIVERIAAATGATVGWLAAGEGEPPTEEEVKAAIAAARAAREPVPPPAASESGEHPHVGATGTEGDA